MMKRLTKKGLIKVVGGVVLATSIVLGLGKISPKVENNIVPQVVDLSSKKDLSQKDIDKVADNYTKMIQKDKNNYVKLHEGKNDLGKQFAFIDSKKGIYELTIDTLGDWNYTFNSKEELEEAVYTYNKNYTKPSNNVDISDVKKFEDKSKLVSLSDGSYYTIDEKNNDYTFFEKDMGTIELKAESLEDLYKIVDTYKAICNDGEC
ncbi:hypothetical protein P5F71_08610 [Clostridium perfringens]|nr:hypothetical protein [Clostridium perfringens]